MINRCLLHCVFAIAGALGSLAAEVPASAITNSYYEERLKSVESAIETLIAGQTNLLMRSDKMADEIQRLNAEVEQLKTANSQAAKPGELKELADKVQELNRNQEADKKLILDEIRKLANLAAVTLQNPTNNPVAQTNKLDNVTEYIIHDGDTLSQIASRFRKQGKIVTVKLILEANKGLKEKNLFVGQKILVPELEPPKPEIPKP